MDAQELPPDFHFGGWEGHADRERRLGLQTTPAQRLEWLEEAIRFVQVVEARRQADHRSAADVPRTPG